jgi:putative DNA primase/helicase
MAAEVERLGSDTTRDVYHACSSFKSEYILVNGVKQYRVPANWGESKSLRVDLDCGQDKFDKGNGYLDKESAIQGIDKFCTDNSFPLPMLVDSGNGIHAYWPFTKSMSSEKWLVLSNAYKQVLTHHGVLADPTCTADFSRILRPPGSLNNKGDPKPVSVIREVPLMRASEVAARIKELATQANIRPEPVRSFNKSINDDLIIPMNKIPSYGAEIANHCEQFRIVRDTQGDVSYEMFRHVIGSLSLCEEGIDLAYKWSKRRSETGHAQNDVAAKFHSWKGGPSLCSTLEKINPQGCANCPRKGEIKTPFILGYSSLGALASTQSERLLVGVNKPPLFMPDKNVKGGTLCTTNNVKTALEDAGFSIGYNQMTKDPTITGPNIISVPDEYSNSSLNAALDTLTRYGVPIGRAPEQINAIAASNPFCPVRIMIESNKWDGKTRFENFMAQIETPHQQEAKFYFRKWLIQAVAAVYLMEGLSAAGMLVLTGQQGIGKTWFLRQLASGVPKGFLEGATLDPSNKDSVMTIASHWIVELGELDATFRKSDLAQLKAFITKKVDKFRRPYAKKDSEFGRRTVMAGTVNDPEFLYDNTGNRRFWVVQVDAINIDLSIDIQQLWAEVKTWYDAKETWHFNKEEQLLLNQHNSQFEVVDPISEKIQMKFNFHEMVKSTWLTATRIAEIAGIDRPGKSELIRVSSTVKSLNGNQFRRSRGLRLLLVPGVHP